MLHSAEALSLCIYTYTYYDIKSYYKHSDDDNNAKLLS